MSDVEHFFDEKITDYDHIACNIIIENLYEFELFELMIMIDENMIIWKKKYIKKYIIIQDQFLELYLMIMNFIYDQARREIEILSIVYKNIIIIDRNVILLNNQIMINTKYHKSQSIMNDIKIYILFYLWLISNYCIFSFMRFNKVDHDIFALYNSISSIYWFFIFDLKFSI